MRLPFKSQERFRRGKKLTKKQLAKANEEINKYIPQQSNQVVLMASLKMKKRSDFDESD